MGGIQRLFRIAVYRCIRRFGGKRLTGLATRTIGCQILLMVWLLPGLFGQSASLRGQVMDDSGAAVPGARVILTEITRITLLDGRASRGAIR